MPLLAFADYTEPVSQISFATNKGILEKLKEHDAELFPYKEANLTEASRKDLLYEAEQSTC